MPELTAERIDDLVAQGACAVVTAPDGRWAYRGKRGCQDVRCTRDGNPDRCYGWHCGHCDGTSNCQANCTCEVPR